MICKFDEETPPFLTQIYSLASDHTGLRNSNKSYCNIPLRISLHYTGDSSSLASGNTKGGFV